MKNCIVVFFLVVLGSALNAQTASDIFHSDVEIVYRGVDYSQTKMVGPEGFTDREKIKDHYFDAWNQLLLDEMDKYDLAAAMQISNFSVDIGGMFKHNQQADEEKFVVYRYEPSWKTEDLQNIVNQYEVPETDAPISVAWIVESLNKKDEIAYMHLVFFKTATNEIIFNDRLKGKPGGFGFRNYWINPFEDAIKYIRKIRYKTWSKIH